MNHAANEALPRHACFIFKDVAKEAQQDCVAIVIDEHANHPFGVLIEPQTGTTIRTYNGLHGEVSAVIPPEEARAIFHFASKGDLIKGFFVSPRAPEELTALLESLNFHCREKVPVFVLHI